MLSISLYLYLSLSLFVHLSLSHDPRGPPSSWSRTESSRISLLDTSTRRTSAVASLHGLFQQRKLRFVHMMFQKVCTAHSVPVLEYASAFRAPSIMQSLEYHYTEVRPKGFRSQVHILRLATSWASTTSLSKYMRVCGMRSWNMRIVFLEFRLSNTIMYRWDPSYSVTEFLNSLFGCSGNQCYIV